MLFGLLAPLIKTSPQGTAFQTAPMCLLNISSGCKVFHQFRCLKPPVPVGVIADEERIGDRRAFADKIVEVLSFGLGGLGPGAAQFGAARHQKQAASKQQTTGSGARTRYVSEAPHEVELDDFDAVAARDVPTVRSCRHFGYDSDVTVSGQPPGCSTSATREVRQRTRPKPGSFYSPPRLGAEFLDALS